MMPPSTKWYLPMVTGWNTPGHAARCAHRLAGVAACKHGALAIFQPRGHDRQRAWPSAPAAAHLLVHIVFELLAQHQATRRKLQVADLGLVQRHGFSCISKAFIPLA